MLSQERVKKIISLGLPIVLAMLSGNVLMLVDTIMVGFLGGTALAASGIAAMYLMLLMAAVSGLSPAVQALVARRMGEKDTNRAGLPLNTGLLLGLLIGVSIGVVGIFLIPSIFPKLVADPEVAEMGTPYFQWLLGGVMMVGVNNAYRGFWNGIGKTANYLKVILVTHILNVIFNYLFIFGAFGFPKMGLTGAGIGSFISIFASVLMFTGMTWRNCRDMGFLSGLPKKEDLKSVLSLSVPSSINDCFFYGGFSVFFWMAGEVSTSALAITVVLARIKMIGIMPGMGFGMGAATLVGQSMGAKDMDAANAWVYDVAKLCFATLSAFAVIMLLFDTQILGVFIQDTSLVEMGTLPFNLIAVVVVFEAVAFVFRFALLGAGDNKRVMKFGIMNQWIIFLPLAWFLGITQGYGLMGLWVAESVHAGLTVLTFTLLWRGGGWSKIKI